MCTYLYRTILAFVVVLVSGTCSVAFAFDNVASPISSRFVVKDSNGSNVGELLSLSHYTYQLGGSVTEGVFVPVVHPSIMGTVLVPVSAISEDAADARQIALAISAGTWLPQGTVVFEDGNCETTPYLWARQGARPAIMESALIPEAPPGNALKVYVATGDPGVSKVWHSYIRSPDFVCLPLVSSLATTAVPAELTAADINSVFPPTLTVHKVPTTRP